MLLVVGSAASLRTCLAQGGPASGPAAWPGLRSPTAGPVRASDCPPKELGAPGGGERGTRGPARGSLRSCRRVSALSASAEPLPHRSLGIRARCVTWLRHVAASRLPRAPLPDAGCPCGQLLCRLLPPPPQHCQDSGHLSYPCSAIWKAFCAHCLGSLGQAAFFSPSDSNSGPRRE